MIAEMKIKLVPPKLNNGKVIPVRGNKPSIEKMFRITCAASHPNIPETISFSFKSTKLSIIRINLYNKPKNKDTNIRVPINPNISPMIANTESLIASGR